MAKDRVTRDELRPIVNGAADEVRDAALALVESVMRDPARAFAPEDLRAALSDGLVLEVHEDPAKRRSALTRLAGRCLAMLALDEAVRGSDVVEAETPASEVFG